MFEIGNKMQLELAHAKNPTPFENLYIYLTNQCNMRCKHCYLGDRLEEKQEMPLEMVLNHLLFWRKLGSKKISFIGGEPTLYPYLREVVESAHSLGYEKVIINTNLSSKALAILQTFSSTDFSYIQTSLDGATIETHDYIRGRGAFVDTTHSIRQLVQNGFDVRIIATINNENLGEVSELITLGEQLGVSLVKFHIMSEIGNAVKGKVTSVSPYEWISLCNRIDSYIKDTKPSINVSYQPSYVYKTDYENGKYHDYPGCLGVEKNRMSVFPDGNCYICSFLFDEKISYAKLVDNTIEINDTSIDHHFENTMCVNCSKDKCAISPCVAEETVSPGAFCSKYNDLYTLCRLWKVTV